MVYDRIEKISSSIVQHGPNNDRVYLMKLHPKDDVEQIIDQLFNLTILKRYTKIFAKVPEGPHQIFLNHNFKLEAHVPGLYNGTQDGYFFGKYFSAKRSFQSKKEKKLINEISETSIELHDTKKHELPPEYLIKALKKKDVPALAKVYKEVFKFYPFPVFEEKYLLKTLKGNVKYYGVFKDDELIAASAAEIDMKSGYAEMTDFATRLKYRGRNFSYFLLKQMINEMKNEDIQTLFTIARATSHGINRTFGRQGFQLGGTLTNNTLIGTSIESMNVWYKHI